MSPMVCFYGTISYFVDEIGDQFFLKLCARRFFEVGWREYINYYGRYTHINISTGLFDSTREFDGKTFLFKACLICRIDITFFLTKKGKS